MTRRMVMLLAVLGGFLVALAAWSYGYLGTRRATAAAARKDLIACRRLAADIARLRRGPTLACDSERVASEVTGLVETAAREAGVPASSLVRIMPAPAQRVGDTVYKEKPTQVILKRASLKQVVRLLWKLEHGDTPLGVKSLMLRAAQPQDDADLWNADVTLTYLVYEPPNPKDQGVPR